MSDAEILTGPESPPSGGGPAETLVILVHGYGANGADLISLAGEWGAHLPDTHFAAPDAPFTCEMAPVGYQWFSLAETSAEAMLNGVTRAAPALDAYIDARQNALGLDDSRTVILGFSQGTMMALHVAPRRAHAVAGVLGYSGLIVAPDRLAGEIRSKPPVQLVHGDADDIVPVAGSRQARQVLTGLGLDCALEERPGLGHGIDSAGLATGLSFMCRVLGKDQSAA